jgi:hypothetical protein
MRLLWIFAHVMNLRNGVPAWILLGGSLVAVGLLFIAASVYVRSACNCP